MGIESENGSSGIWKKVGLAGVVAAVGAGVGLLLTAKPKRLRETVSELPGNARNLVEDVTERVRSSGDEDGAGSPMPQEISDEFEARRRERRERRERRGHPTT